MKVNFHGNTCFSINDKDFSVVTDPHSKASGLKANVVTVSSKENDSHNVDAVEGEKKVFNWPGEYEISGVHFQGIATFHNPKESKEQKENTVFTISLNGVHLCHLGGLGTSLTAEQTEEIGDVDILFLPVGGKNTIDAKKAKEVIEQIEPRIIIPMAYCDDDHNCDVSALQPFLSEMGTKDIEPLDEFILKRSELPDDTSKIVVLNKK